MVVDNTNKKRILARILSGMIMLIVFFMIYILFSSTSENTDDSITLYVKKHHLNGFDADVILVKNHAIAAYKKNNRWRFLLATHRSTGCVVTLKNNNQWFDICSKQSFSLDGKAIDSDKGLMQIEASETEFGFTLTLGQR